MVSTIVKVQQTEWTDEDEAEFQREHDAWLEQVFPSWATMTPEQRQQASGNYEFSHGAYNHPWA